MFLASTTDTSVSTADCQVCHYDVRGLHIDRSGIGTCPECGSPFVIARSGLTVKTSPTTLRPRGLIAFALIVSTMYLPEVLAWIARTMSMLGDPRIGRGIIGSLGQEYSRHSDRPQVLIGGAACAMAAAMLLSGRIPLSSWFARIALSLVAWLTLYAVILPPHFAFPFYAVRVPLDRNAAPIVGGIVGIMSVGALMILARTPRVPSAFDHAAQPSQANEKRSANITQS